MIKNIIELNEKLTKDGFKTHHDEGINLYIVTDIANDIQIQYSNTIVDYRISIWQEGNAIHTCVDNLDSLYNFIICLTF